MKYEPLLEEDEVRRRNDSDSSAFVLTARHAIIHSRLDDQTHGGADGELSADSPETPAYGIGRRQLRVGAGAR